MTDITYGVEGDYRMPSLILYDNAGDSPEEIIWGNVKNEYVFSHLSVYFIKEL